MAGKKGALAGWELSAAGTPFGPPKERGGEAEAAALARAEERETAARAREKDRGGRGKGEELNEKGRERRGKFLAPRGATSCHRGLIAACGFDFFFQLLSRSILPFHFGISGRGAQLVRFSTPSTRPLRRRPSQEMGGCCSC